MATDAYAQHFLVLPQYRINCACERVGATGRVGWFQMQHLMASSLRCIIEWVSALLP